MNCLDRCRGVAFYETFVINGDIETSESAVHAIPLGRCFMRATSNAFPIHQFQLPVTHVSYLDRRCVVNDTILSK